MAGLVAMAGYGIKDLQFKSDYRMFFSDDNPQLTALENLQKTYTRDDNVLLVLTPAKGDVFSPEILAIAQRLTKDLWQTPYSTRVDSLVNFQYSHANGDEVTVEDLVGDIAQLTPEDLTRIKLYALQEPLLVNRLVSPNAKVMGFNVVILRPGINQDSETVEVTRYVRKLADSLRAEHPDLDVRITGSILMDTAFAESSELDMRTLTPAMLTIIAIALWFFLRSFWGMVTVLIMMTLAVIATVGMTGWLGIAFSPSSIPAPTILLTLVVANSVHLLTSFYKSVNDGANPHEAIGNSIAKNFKAIVFCNFTTVIGFLTMNSSESPPFRDLGNITAMGMVITFFLSMVLQPALMAIFPAAGRPRWGSNEGWKKFAHFVIKYRHYCLIGMTLAVAVLATGIRLNALDDEYVKYFDSSVEFRRDTDYTSDHLTGIYRIDYSLEKNNGDGISDPDFLQRVDAFVQWYRQQPEVTHVFAVTDIFKRLNQNMHSDDPAWYRLPETAEMSAQFLLLYEMSLPYGLDLNDRINVNKSATRVSVTLHSISSQQVLDLEARAQAWLKVNAPNFARHEGTGITLLFAHIGQRNIASMIDGLVLAAIIIALTLIAVLRSTLLGLLSLIPNVIPSIMVFGVWGMLVGQIGMASSVVVAMTLGILVDDTVHFLTQYQYARNQKGLSPEAAVEYAFSQIGNALWVTSFILILGFAIFALSSFKINQEMGMLTTLIFAVGLLADFILLPPILLFIEGFRKSAKASSLVEKKAV
ncbi:MAG: efflux RND transporter permease subunit [Nitrosomonas sp.]|uniref:efflux RND transporter permease subunit n=1 Tax=Nitrosomonas sp. TaxID=42353 RepID=UPI0025E7F1D6|nr:efflux RND transporter permease subunit [Nitrosomonas sp.]UJP03146.1 MAG: efflux RND transporter permease subunit [Nitrosomonas sp.]